MMWAFPMQELALGIPFSEYKLEKTALFNSRFDKIEGVFENKYSLLYAKIHGSPQIISFGFLSSEDDYAEKSLRDSVYTTRQEYADYAEKHGAPFLFVELTSCNVERITDSTKLNDIDYCWPQTMLRAGTWIYYIISGGGSQTFQIQQSIAGAPFFGSVIRDNPTTNVMSYGDITAYIPREEVARGYNKGQQDQKKIATTKNRTLLHDCIEICDIQGRKIASIPSKQPHRISGIYGSGVSIIVSGETVLKRIRNGK